MIDEQRVSEVPAGTPWGEVRAWLEGVARDAPDWSGALCAQTDPDAWFPDHGVTKRVLAMCAACPVRDACRDYALTHDERFGVWGGLTERARKRLRRASRA